LNTFLSACYTAYACTVGQLITSTSMDVITHLPTIIRDGYYRWLVACLLLPSVVDVSLQLTCLEYRFDFSPICRIR